MYIQCIYYYYKHTIYRYTVGVYSYYIIIIILSLRVQQYRTAEYTDQRSDNKACKNRLNIFNRYCIGYIRYIYVYIYI